MSEDRPEYVVRLDYGKARCMGRAIESAAVPMPYPECEDCRRRTSPGNPHLQSWQKPHVGPGPCPDRIPQIERGHAS